MAVDYDKLFTILGKHVKHVNLMYAHVAEIGTHQTQLATVLSEAGMAEMVDDLPDLMQGAQDNITQWIIGDSKSLSDRLLLDPILVVDELGMSAPPTVRNVLEAITLLGNLAPRLEGNSGQTDVNPDVTSGLDGAVDILWSKLLDGNTPPANDIPRFKEWAGVASTLSSDLTLKISCIGDSESNNLQMGSELFLVEGGINNGFYSRRAEGTGQVQVTALNNQNIFPAGKFDGYTSTSTNPTGFTNVSGTPGNDFSPASNGLRDTICLAAVIGGEFDLRGNISPVLLTRNRTFFLHAYAKRTSTLTSGSVTISLIDGSGTLASVTVAHGSLTADWQLFWTAFTVGDQVFGTPYIKIATSAAYDNDVVFDDVGLSPASYINGVALGIMTGAWPVLADPSSNRTAEVVSGATGYTFQDYFRKQYRFQMPYSGALPTIADSLAQ